jgi:hypothetical protein
MYQNNEYKRDSLVDLNLRDELRKIEQSIKQLQQVEADYKSRLRSDDYPTLTKLDEKGRSPQTDLDEVTDLDGNVLYTSNELYYTIVPNRKRISWEYKEVYSAQAKQSLHDSICMYPDKASTKYDYAVSKASTSLPDESFYKYIVMTVKPIDEPSEKWIAYKYNAEATSWDMSGYGDLHKWTNWRDLEITKLKTKLLN